MSDTSPLKISLLFFVFAFRHRFQLSINSNFRNCCNDLSWNLEFGLLLASFSRGSFSEKDLLSNTVRVLKMMKEISSNQKLEKERKKEETA